MELRWRPVLVGLPRTGDVPAGPARRERSGKAGPGLARDPEELNVAFANPVITGSIADQEIWRRR